MLEKLFFPQKGEKLDRHNPEGDPSGNFNMKTETDEEDEEFQIPSLHRKNYLMTAELLRRREEETLRRHYDLPPSKTGTYL